MALAAELPVLVAERTHASMRDARPRFRLVLWTRTAVGGLNPLHGQCFAELSEERAPVAAKRGSVHAGQQPRLELGESRHQPIGVADRGVGERLPHRLARLPDREADSVSPTRAWNQSPFWAHKLLLTPKPSTLQLWETSSWTSGRPWVPSLRLRSRCLRSTSRAGTARASSSMPAHGSKKPANCCSGSAMALR